MDTIDLLRKQVKEYVDGADEVTVKMLHAMLQVQQQNDWFDALPGDVQFDIDVALKDLDEGKGISHEKVKEMYPQWFSKSSGQH